MSGSPPALDPAVLESLRQLTEPGEPDVLAEVLRVFVTDAPARLQAIAKAIERRDAADLQRAAHGLKGAAAAIGADGLHSVCRELEGIGQRAALDQIDAALEQLRAEFERVQRAIEQLL